MMTDWARYALINTSDNSWNSGPFVTAPDPIPDGTWLYDGVPPDYLENFDGWDRVHSGFRDKPGPAPLISVGRFLTYITLPEQIAIHAAAETDIAVRALLFWLQGFTDGISLSDEMLAGLLQILVGKNLLTSDRVSAILAGQAPQ